MRNILCGMAMLSLAACATTAAVLTGVGVAVQAGQEVCAIGQTIAAIDNADGTPLTVTGKAAADVAKVCTDLGGVVVSPPPAGQTVPTITVATPVATVTAGPTGASVTVPAPVAVAPVAK